MLFGTLALVAPDRTWFWIAGMALGTFMGPAQAPRRTLIARLAPPAPRAERFGLYSLSGKATNFAGPLAHRLAHPALSTPAPCIAALPVIPTASLPPPPLT